jgi:uncharacterized protein
MTMQKANVISLFTGLVPAILLLFCACSSDRSGTYSSLKSGIDQIWIVNTHEHFNTEAGRMASDVDFFTLVEGYLLSDLTSSGMPREDRIYIKDGNIPVEDRWKVFYPHWQKVKNTGYGRSLSQTVKGLFDINVIDDNTFPDINRKMLETNKKQGWYKHVLKDKSRIGLTIIDPLGSYTHADTVFPAEFFVKVRRFDNFVTVNENNIAAIGQQYGQQINNLSDYLNVLDIAFKKAVEVEGIVGVKSGLAYHRKIHYEDVPAHRAGSLFSKLHENSQRLDSDEQKLLEDFMMHQVIERAVKYDLPIQIHTGILTGNFNNNPIGNTNAVHLSNLFQKFREGKFILFHGNFPYMDELSYLAKHYPNVYIDMCWMHIVSPSASKRYLEEWLLTVPSNKIMAFGGDYTVTELTHGHSLMARQTVAEVLTKMVHGGHVTEEEALVLAERILKKNALDLFKLEKADDQWRRKL